MSCTQLYCGRPCPDPLLDAAHNPAQAVLLTTALLLDKRPEIRTRQLTLIDSRLGEGAADLLCKVVRTTAGTGI